ncbi:M14 family zinc carboxypeptidase [Photobacterium rosenbergii]|uniref:M14 family zinc carboxypeptidase n=1 Tax=Photobacterium rosenbergii TaxID=294936 RepID=UPI001C999FE5|nr:M14 family zinc carboxypeptidase [Photobacterium rosenbergii]MBY5944522.1 peptidase [Photobacterium rosenbergii]
MKKQYISYRDMMDFLEEAMAKYPDLIRLQSIGDTHEGRPIMMVTISQDVAYADLKPALLYTGTIHAREWIGIELAVSFVQYLLDNYPSNPDVVEALTRNTLYMVPCLNPDGFEYSRKHFSFWRKNRRDNGDGTFGVDLNRNFGINFRQSTQTNSNIYGGPGPFSEPETQAIKQFVESRDNICVALDYHSQGNVFFPAHKFNHEAEIEGTDLNILCANMAREIYKVTNRQYGIHRGKPPANLIHGSGREYYYDRGILSTVVEVGSRNIPDYLINMSQSVDENIPALLYALRTTIDYSKLAPSRPESFSTKEITANTVELVWESGAEDEGCYYQIYRSETPKAPCTRDNLIAITSQLRYTDKQLKSGRRYFYNLRKVNRVTRIKSPFAPELKIKTLLERDEFSFTLFPSPEKIGYVGELTRGNNAEHFGHNSLFIGVNKTKGICYGVIDYDMSRLPADAKIKDALFSLYPMNRVGAKIENYGEWSVSILDPDDISDITDFEQIHNATPIQTLGDAIDSDQLTQGIWKSWHFSAMEKELIEQQLEKGRLLLRLQGPVNLPMGNDSQMMQFDIGYGRFGGGIHYRPNLDLIYQRKPYQLAVGASACHTVKAGAVEASKLQSGYDANGERIFGVVDFTLPRMSEQSDVVFTDAYFVLESASLTGINQPMRFLVEMVDVDEPDFEQLTTSEPIEFIGYEVSSEGLAKTARQTFMFDSSARQYLEDCYDQNRAVKLVIKATSASRQHDAVVEWKTDSNDGTMSTQLVVEYIERRKQPLETPENFRASLEGGMVKLTWDNPEDSDWVGTYVVRNSFHPPRSPFDGVKLYAGKDGYTFDKFGNANLAKYYSVFNYDNVPNYSAPASLKFSSDEITPVEFDEFEAQDEVEQRYRQGD